MGKGIIKANRGGGEYLVEIVFDRSRIDAELLKLAENKTKLEAKLYTGTPAQDDLLRLQIAAIDKRVAYINEHAPSNVERVATCVDYTENIEVGAAVGTIEIARRPNQVWKNDTDDPAGQYSYTSGYWIRPGFNGGATYNAVRDGILNPTINQSPAGVFWNMALLPGAQKWRPRYRRGVITELDGNYCNVSLTDLVYLTEAKAEIDIDQTLDLKDVPIEYMDCNGSAFESGDAVIVEFTGSDWNAPKVIGFYDEPAPCNVFYFSIVFGWYGNENWRNDWYERLFFKIDPLGDFEWVSPEEVDSHNLNMDDWFTETKQRAFYPAPRPGVYVFYGKTYQVGKPAPAEWENFENLYASGWNYYDPGITNLFFLVGNLKVHLFQSQSAVGLATKKFTKTWLTSYLREIVTTTEVQRTGGRWGGFGLEYDERGPGTYSIMIATRYVGNSIWWNGEVITIPESYYSADENRYVLWTVLTYEGCVAWNTKRVYDSEGESTKYDYGEGIAPTIETVLDYLYPETVNRILNKYCVDTEFPHTPSKYWSSEEIQGLSDAGYEMDYTRVKYWDGSYSEPERIGPRTCYGGDIRMYTYTGYNVTGDDGGLVYGPWWVPPRFDNAWINPVDIFDFLADAPIVGENWHSESNDKRGTNNWYNRFYGRDYSDRIYQFFYREVSNQYRLSINYKYFKNEKSIVAIIEKNGELADDGAYDGYQTFSEENGDIMLYDRNASRVLTNKFIAPLPAHWESSKYNDFISAKRAQYLSQVKTVDFVSAIWPILN